MLMGIVNLQTPGAHYYLPQGHSSADQIPKLTDLRLKIAHQQSGGELRHLVSSVCPVCFGRD